MPNLCGVNQRVISEVMAKIQNSKSQVSEVMSVWVSMVTRLSHHGLSRTDHHSFMVILVQMSLYFKTTHSVPKMCVALNFRWS